MTSFCAWQEHRQNALLEVEKTIKQQQEYEMEVQTTLKAHRKKVINSLLLVSFLIFNLRQLKVDCLPQLLEDLALQQTQLEQELEKVQQERDINRERLLSYIYNGISFVLIRE